MVRPLSVLLPLFFSVIGYQQAFRPGVGAARYLKSSSQSKASVAVRILSVHCDKPSFADERLASLVPVWVAVPWIKMRIDGKPLVFFGEEILATTMLRVAHTGKGEARLAVELFDGKISLGKATIDARDDDASTGIAGGWHKLHSVFPDGKSSVTFEVQFEGEQNAEVKEELDQRENDMLFWEDYMEYEDNEIIAASNSSLSSEEREAQILASQAMTQGHRNGTTIDLGFSRHSAGRRYLDNNVQALRTLLGIRQEELQLQEYKAHGIVGKPKDRSRRAARNRHGAKGSPKVKFICGVLQELAPDVPRSTLRCRENEDLRLYFVCGENEMLICFFKASAVEIQFCRQVNTIGEDFKLLPSGQFQLPVTNFLRRTSIKGRLLRKTKGLVRGELLFLDQPMGHEAPPDVRTYVVQAPDANEQLLPSNPIRDLQGVKHEQFDKHRQVFAGKDGGKLSMPSGNSSGSRVSSNIRSARLSTPQTPKEKTPDNSMESGLVDEEEFDFGEFPDFGH